MATTASTRFDLTPPDDAQVRELVAGLTDEERHVLLEHGTETPFCGIFLNEKRPGAFTCRLCGLPLFHGGTKFESGTGWPSFWKPLPGAIGTTSDRSLLMERTEVHCAKCGGHLGHVFNDGPQPTGLRYCMNGDAMLFVPA